MKLILQIAAGVLLAKFVWWIGEVIVTAAALKAAENSWNQAMKDLNKPVPNLPYFSAPPATSQPQLPRYPFPANELPVGALACMNGVTVRHETNGWTQVSGSVTKPTCAK